MPRVRLDSWKSIAEYLKRSQRTVQRWHANFGLPVHHFGGSKGPVFSYSDELDQWLSGFVGDAAHHDVLSGDPRAVRRHGSRELTTQADELWDLRSENNLSAIAALYRGAVDQDPANAAAFVGLADSLILSALVGVMRGSAAYPRAGEALIRAHRLGHESTRSVCAAAWLQMAHGRKWKRAEEGFNEALDRDPNSAHSLTGQALLQIADGNLTAASRNLSEAWRQNTFASVTTACLSWSHYLAGEFDLARMTVSQASASGEGGALISAVEALSLLQSPPISHKLRRIEEIARRHAGCLIVQGVLGYAYGVSDQPGRAREVLHGMDRMKGDAHYPLALVLLGIHEWQQSLSCLEASYAEGSLWSLGFRSDPILQPLRDDPRLERRLRKLGP